jgi:hypothetical protein
MSKLIGSRKSYGDEARPATPSRFWVKLDALLHRNPKIARLTDAQFRAYITVLGEAKLCQSEGEWPSEEHLRFAIGAKASRHIPTLVDARLLEVDRDGWVRVHDWNDWQPRDPTAAARSARYRARQKAERDTRNVTRDATTSHTHETRQIYETDGSTVAPGGLGSRALVGRCPGCESAVYQDEDHVAVRIHGAAEYAHRRCLAE